MRLICPNCDAQYEVDASLVPSTGRDVQCSNCGKTWFQEPVETLRLTTDDEVQTEPSVEEQVVEDHPAEAEADVAAEYGAVDDDGRSGDGLSNEAAEFFGQVEHAAATEDMLDEDVDLPQSFETAASAADQGLDLVDETVEDLPNPAEIAAHAVDDGVAYENRSEPPMSRYDDDGDLAVAEPPVEDLADETPDRPEIDSAVLGILKAEAEREIAARRADETGVETQPELGISEPERDRADIDARTARLRGADEEPDYPDTSARSTQLPDVDEINSTLTATTDRVSAEDPAAAVQGAVAETVRKRRSGFRFGFSLMIMLAAALILVYLFAPQISDAAPTATPYLVSYVDWANGIRQTVDAYLSDGVERLTSLLIDLTT